MQNFCTRSPCKWKGFGQLCRSCQARRATLIAIKKRDGIPPDQRAEVAETIKNNPDRPYWMIAEDWLTSPAAIARIAKKFGVARCQKQTQQKA